MAAWRGKPEQRRGRPLSETLALAKVAARSAGVSRLADMTGMTPLGVPVFQSVRPLSHSLSVSQGKGLTPMSAQIGALLEAVEFHAAERLSPAGPLLRLLDLDNENREIWTDAEFGCDGIRLDPSLERYWVRGWTLGGSRPCFVPWDLASLDFTREPCRDASATSSGLASGNSLVEASVSAVAELVERHASFLLDRSSPRERRALEVDAASIDDPVLRALLRHFTACGFAYRVWASGLPMGIASFDCVLIGAGTGGLPPVGGSGCHPDPKVALLRALLEAVQSLATLLAGARDDLTFDSYGEREERWLQILVGALSFGPGPVRWSDVPASRAGDPEEALDSIGTVAARLTSTPVLLFEHDPPAPGISLVHAFAPGLFDSGRVCSRCVDFPNRVGRRPRNDRLVVFAGPSVRPGDVDTSFVQLAPARCGDLSDLLDDPPAAVGLIDGCFATGPTVWHKEIIALIAAGTTVYGAASIGALRAAELGAHGMIGIGAIHCLYSTNLVTRDDAVMLTHAPAELDYHPLTISLVDAEYALLCADLGAFERRMLQRIVRNTHFEQRTWASCFAAYENSTGRAPSAEARSLESFPSLKRADALLLLQTLAGHRKTAHAIVERPRAPSTSFYQAMLAARYQARRSTQR